MRKFLAGALTALAFLASATFALDQLSKKDPDGTVLGQSTTDKISFYGVTPIVQPSGSAQGALTDSSGGTAAPTTGVSANAQKELVLIPVPTLSTLAGGFVYKLSLPYAYTVTSALFRAAQPVSTGSKLATLQLRVDGTAMTGGAMSLTSATLTPSGASVAASTITGNNAGAAGQPVEFLISSVTAFSEGSGWVELTVTNGDKANQSSTLAAFSNAVRTALLNLGLIKGSS